MKKEEMWKLIDREREVFVSNFGRVVTTNYQKCHEDKLLAIFPISGKNNKALGVTFGGRTYLLRRLVAKAFIGEIPDGFVVRHKNGLYEDCRADNLEICSRSKAMLAARFHSMICEAAPL